MSADQRDTNPRAIKRTLRVYLSLMLQHWHYTLMIVITVAFGSTLVFYIPPLIIAELIRMPAGTPMASLWPYVAWFGVAWFGGEMLWRFALHLMIRFEVNVIQKTLPGRAYHPTP